MGFETTCADGSQLFITAQTCCVIERGADEFLSGNFVVHDALP
jgi:hypothetical protein